MNFHNGVYGFLTLRWYLVLAQQSCYWPDGSEAGKTVNCYSAQDSTCCWPTDFCLSNGLCYSPKGVIHSMRLWDHPFIVLCEAPDTELFIGFYRGGCTIKDWSNTSVCLTQFCGESKSLNTTSMLSALDQVKPLHLMPTTVNQFYNSKQSGCLRMSIHTFIWRSPMVVWPSK